MGVVDFSDYILSPVYHHVIHACICDCDWCGDADKNMNCGIPLVLLKNHVGQYLKDKSLELLIKLAGTNRLETKWSHELKKQELGSGVRTYAPQGPPGGTPEPEGASGGTGGGSAPFACGLRSVMKPRPRR